MGQPFTIVHQLHDGYDERGHVSEERISYVKLESSFRRGPLAAFSGSQLKVFIDIALHEVDDQPGASFNTIARETGLCRHSVISAIQFLSDKERPFIRYDGREADGSNRYRVVSFAWAGRDHNLPSPKNTPSLEKKSFSRHDDDVVIVPDPDSESKHHHHECTSAENIFRAAGFAGANLLWLGRNIAPPVADAWSEWVKRVRENAVLSETYPSPHGYAWTCLHADPNTMPPELPEVEPVVEIPPAEVFGLGRAGELWREIVCALPMTDQAAYAHLVATRVVDWDDDGETLHIVALDESNYILTRLREAIEFQLRAYTGRKVELDCVTAR